MMTRMTVQPVGADDLPPVVSEQPGVAVVHDVLQALEDLDGFVEVGSDELVGDVAPHAEFDEFAVEQDESAVHGQGAVGGDAVEEAGFAAAGFSAGEDVAVDEVQVDALAELVDTDEQRVEHRQPGMRGHGRDHCCGMCPQGA